MKPNYSSLKRNHYSTRPGADNYRSGEDLYSEIGYDFSKLKDQDPNFQNTCAIRMSLALLKSGTPIRGRLKIQAGDLKGKMIEPGAKLLADQLMHPTLLGKPVIFTEPTKAPQALHAKNGIVFFWKIAGFFGGHIDLLETENALLTCNSFCYFDCKEVWFWPLS